MPSEMTDFLLIAIISLLFVIGCVVASINDKMGKL